MVGEGCVGQLSRRDISFDSTLPLLIVATLTEFNVCVSRQLAIYVSSDVAGFLEA